MAGEAGSSSARSFMAVFRNSALRRVSIAWGASQMGHVSIAVGLAVFAYHAGGTSAVGLIYVLRLASAAIATPFAAVLGDRFSRPRVMLGANVSRFALTAGVTAAAAERAPSWFVYALSIGVAVAGTPFRPAQVAYLPALVDTPEELTAANVVSSTIEGLGFFAGPALAGVLLALTGTTAVFGFCTVLFACSTLTILRLPWADEHEATERATREEPLGEAVLVGARVIGRDGDLRVLVGLFTSQTLVAGAYAVILVVTAISLLRIGSSGVGWLDAAVGVGGVAGSLIAASLAGRRRLAPPFLLGIVLWGVPFVAVAAWPSVALALIAFALIGVGNILVDVAGYTLLQRAVEDRVLARVFGAFETLSNASMALGALLVPPLVRLAGTRWTLCATGLFLPALATVVSRRLLLVDHSAAAPERAVALLRGIPLFAPLPVLALERLALHLVGVAAPAGVEVIRQGEVGDRYYLLASGAADVLVDGVRLNRLAPGEGFGEIALLRDVPRTASVVTAEPSDLFWLDRATFLDAVSANPRSFAAADEMVSRRLGTLSGAV